MWVIQRCSCTLYRQIDYRIIVAVVRWPNFPGFSVSLKMRFASRNVLSRSKLCSLCYSPSGHCHYLSLTKGECVFCWYVVRATILQSPHCRTRHSVSSRIAQAEERTAPAVNLVASRCYAASSFQTASEANAERRGRNETLSTIYTPETRIRGCRTCSLRRRLRERLLLVVCIYLWKGAG